MCVGPGRPNPPVDIRPACVQRQRSSPAAAGEAPGVPAKALLERFGCRCAISCGCLSPAAKSAIWPRAHPRSSGRNHVHLARLWVPGRSYMSAAPDGRVGYTDRAFLWPSVLVHIVSISITYLVGRKLNGNGTRHYFCEIPFEYSGFVLSGICAVVYVFFLFLSGQPPS